MHDSAKNLEALISWKSYIKAYIHIFFYTRQQISVKAVVNNMEMLSDVKK